MNENILENIIAEKANDADLTFAKNFNGHNYALMDVDWIGYYNTLDEVKEFLGISDIDCLNVVLNMIKADIEKQKEVPCFDDADMYIYKTGLNDAIDIVNKYMNESEGNDET